VCMVGSSRKQNLNAPPEVVCTLYEGGMDSDDEAEACTEGPEAAKYGPITLGYQGTRATLRPWHPQNCVIAAGIHNRLIHFPFRPGSLVFVLGCSLQTLGHIADIVGKTGRVTGVINEQPDNPSEAALVKFRRRYRCATVIVENIEKLSLERYELLLSLPKSSKYAFLMALHPRLGADSPANQLAAAPKRVLRTIFDFLENGDLARVKCLVVCHWPAGASSDSIREIVLSHIDIFRQWRSPPQTDEVQECSGPEGKDVPDACATKKSAEEEEGNVSGAAPVTSDPAQSKTKTSDSALQWVLMDVSADAADDAPPLNMSTKLTAVVASMKRLPSGTRTGLLAKELLLLAPYFPGHALLVLKYMTHDDSRLRASGRSHAAHGLEGSDSSAAPARPPKTQSMPVPSFLKRDVPAASEPAATEPTSTAPPVPVLKKRSKASRARQHAEPQTQPSWAETSTPQRWDVSTGSGRMSSSRQMEGGHRLAPDASQSDRWGFAPAGPGGASSEGAPRMAPAWSQWGHCGGSPVGMAECGPPSYASWGCYNSREGEGSMSQLTSKSAQWGACGGSPVGVVESGPPTYAGWGGQLPREDARDAYASSTRMALGGGQADSQDSLGDTTRCAGGGGQPANLVFPPPGLWGNAYDTSGPPGLPHYGAAFGSGAPGLTRGRHSAVPAGAQ